MVKHLFGVCFLTLFSLSSFSQETSPQDGNPYSYDVSSDPESASANVLQILEKLPNVMVSAAGEISLAGCSGAVIYIDGIQQTTKYDDSSLKSFPANRVKCIEIRTLPNISDQLSGDYGVIYITTRKQEGNGTSATVTAQGSTSSTIGSGLLLNMKYKKFFLDGGYSFRYQDQYNITYSDVHTPSEKTYNRHIKTHNASLHTGFEFTKRDVIGVVFTSILNNWDSQIDKYTPPIRQDQPNYNTAAYYKHNFSKGATLKLSYTNSQNKQENRNYFYNIYRSNDWRMDVSIPTGKAGHIEFGGNYYTGNSESFDYYSMDPDPSEMSSEYKRWSVYSQYVWKLSTLQFHAGLLGSEYTLSNDSDEPFRLAPYLGMGWNINTNNHLALQYTYQHSSSNVFIQQKYIHKAELNYHHTQSKWSFMADLNYMYSKSSTYILFNNTENGKDPYYDVYENADWHQAFLSLSARYALSRMVNLHGSGILINQYMIPGPYESSNTMYGKLTAGTDIFLPTDFCLAINGGYYLSQDNGRRKEMPNYFYRLNLSKEFAGKRLKASLYATDFFGKKKLETTYQDYYTPVVTSEYTFPTNEFGLSLSYRFL